MQVVTQGGLMLKGRLLARLIVPGLLFATVGHAQSGIALTPTIGLYAPATHLVDATIGGEDIRLKQDVAVALGGRFSLLFGQRITVSATGAFVPSTLKATIDGVEFDEGKVNLWFASARATFWLSPPTAPVSFGLGGGLAFIGRGATRLVTPGNQTLTSPSETDVGGVFTGVIGLNLGRLGAFVAVDNYLYQPKVFDQYGVANPMQNDLHFTLGLGIPIGGGR